MKSKKKKSGKYTGILAALVLCWLPMTAQAGDLTYGLENIPTRVMAGYTLRSGMDDPGEGASIGLNNLLSAVSSTLTVPGFVVGYKGQRVLELGALSGGYGGPSGDDTATRNDGHAFLGLGGYLLEYVSAHAIWVLDSQAESNYAVFAGIDVAKLSPKISTLVSSVWQRTGL